MGNKIIMLLLITLSSLSLGGNEQDNYNKIEKKSRQITSFVENGVKLEYESNLTIDEEKETIRNIIADEYKVISELDNSMILKGKYKIDIGIWSENGTTYINATIMNDRKQHYTKNLKDELENLVHNNVKNEKFFEFYKGKLEEDLKMDDIIKINSNKLEVLKIENGYTGKIKLGKENVNFGLINYDTGLHLIIGTPVIFTTY